MQFQLQLLAMAHHTVMNQICEQESDGHELVDASPWLKKMLKRQEVLGHLHSPHTASKMCSLAEGPQWRPWLLPSMWLSSATCIRHNCGSCSISLHEAFEPLMSLWLRRSPHHMMHGNKALRINWEYHSVRGSLDDTSKLASMLVILTILYTDPLEVEPHSILLTISRCPT